MEYLFVLATFIFIFGFDIVFRKMMNIIANDHNSSINLQALQSKLFLRVALLEIVPILLIIFTFISLNNANVEGLNNTIPLILIIFILLIGMIRVFVSFRHAKESTDDVDLKKQLQTLLILSIPLISAIPILSIVFLIVTQG